MRTSLYFLFLFLMIYSFDRSYAAQLPNFTVKKTATAPTIDGKLDEAMWQHCDTMRLKNCVDGTSPTLKTLAFAAWDAQNLYCAMVTEDKDVWGTITAHDGNLYTEEAVELFIDPDGDGKNYFEYEFNCKNAYMDMFMIAPYDQPGGGGDAGWSSTGLSYKVVVHGTANNKNDTDTGMVVEMKIPFSDLKRSSVVTPVPTNGSTFRVNFYRIENTTTLYAWSPTGSTFHAPQLFGTFTFSDSLINTNPTNITSPGTMTSDRMRLTVRGDKSILRYTLDNTAFVTAAVFDGKGRNVKNLWQGYQKNGSRMIIWDHCTTDGSAVISGAYFLHVTIDRYNFVKTLIVAK